jgi:hypothetical protein
VKKSEDKPYFKGLDVTVVTSVKSSKTKINNWLKKTGRDAIMIGGVLYDVKKNKLIHGQFEAWVRSELNISPQQARRYMKVFVIFGGKEKEIAQYGRFGPTILYEIAALHRDYIKEIRKKASSDGLDVDFLQDILDRAKKARQEKLDAAILVKAVNQNPPPASGFNQESSNESDADGDPEGGSEQGSENDGSASNNNSEPNSGSGKHDSGGEKGSEGDESEDNNDSEEVNQNKRGKSNKGSGNKGSGGRKNTNKTSGETNNNQQKTTLQSAPESLGALSEAAQKLKEEIKAVTDGIGNDGDKIAEVSEEDLKKYENAFQELFDEHSNLARIVGVTTNETLKVAS